MNPVFPARKRAEQFSSMLEDSSTTGLRDVGSNADLLPLVGIVTALRTAPAPEPRPEFVTDLRTRLMLAAETALAPDTAAQVEARRQPAPRRTGRERRLAVAIGGFAIVSASASMSVAAQTALPGDTLYPLKRAIENAHEGVLRDADDKGATMLDNASGRLDEVDELSRSGGPDATVISQTLQDFTEQAVEASDVLLGDYAETGRLSSIEELRSFTTSSLEALQRLETLVPLDARSSLVEATRALDMIDAQAVSACPACSDLPALAQQVTAAADLGPLYQHLLDTAAALEAPAAPRPPTPAPKPPTRTGGQPAPSVATPSPQPAGDDPAPTPDLTAGGDQGAPSSLETLVTGVNSVDLGNLLTGTVDDVTQGVDDLLGGRTGK
ncbi:DUF5667 domain-containing protein [Nocardioides rubriscoriae]|uniref:DUF5667 domain-containing protein n=1 Tax=Nocardioides rubriscoriae TaxID=642762 RepID=UPI0011E0333A|nr:DUF5667 domain-containing protein [Nocardioides rubriscoriae]